MTAREERWRAYLERLRALGKPKAGAPVFDKARRGRTARKRQAARERCLEATGG